MPLYELTKDSINPIESIRFSDVGLRERGDLQRILREKIEIVCPDTLVVAEEFGEWEDSRRRIDLLGVDQSGNLVVIELKRTEDGGHMDLQALRYAAMISTLNFERVVEIFDDHLQKMERDGDARALLLDHLNWATPDEGMFGAGVRIVLAAADFSREITTSVLWLNEQGLDIRCVRMSPYRHGESFFVDVQQVIPLPEASEYTVRIRAKRRETLEVKRAQERDFSKFILTLGGDRGIEPLNKRRSMLEIVRYLVQGGVSPYQIKVAIKSVVRHRVLIEFDGVLDSSGVRAAFEQARDTGQLLDYDRFFHDPDELLHYNQKTFVLTKMWGIHTQDCLNALCVAFPHYRLDYEIAG